MNQPIEISIDTPDGIADCSLEPQEKDGLIIYCATILYPNMVNGFSRSEVYLHYMYPTKTGTYQFDPMDENIHPKIKKMEGALARVIANT